jgi:hypothetical protein
MSMLRPALTLISLALFNGGCATTTHFSAGDAAPLAAGFANTDQQRADRYLDTLRAKKNRFLSENGFEANYVPGVSPSQNVVQADNIALGLSDCDKISYGNWSASVMYGQTFDAYANFVRTMERCYQASHKG